MLLSEKTSPELGPREGRVALLPVGSVEPHGPHLPLGTDTLLSEATAARAYEALTALGYSVLIAPTVPYGVTDFAAGFAGAVSIPSEVFSSFIEAVARGLLSTVAAHVVIINNHLEPAHDAALREVAARVGAESVSVASPLERRFARTLTAEFKSGACHAGQYESSMILAVRPELVRPCRHELADVPISLSQGIALGQTTFESMGMTEAYAGSPRQATAPEGDDSLAKLTAIVTTLVEEKLGRR